MVEQGFCDTDAATHSLPDVYVMPAQIQVPAKPRNPTRHLQERQGLNCKSIDIPYLVAIENCYYKSDLSKKEKFKDKEVDNEVQLHTFN